MPLFRATIWTLSATAAAVEGNAGLERRVVEYSADDEEDFIACVTDSHTRHVDDSVSFGPISQRQS